MLFERIGQKKKKREKPQTGENMFNTHITKYLDPENMKDADNPIIRMFIMY